MPTAIITGGTRGIGKSLILKFASHGFNIATCARNESDLLQLSAEINKAFPKVKCLAITCDVGNKKQLIAFGQQAIASLGPIDVLINNAGQFVPGSIMSEADGDFENLINVNLASAYHLTRVIVPIMIEQKAGYIFNLCSTASIKAYTNGGSYCISKFGLLGFSKVLREELKEYGIRVSAVLPGPTDTSSWAGSNLPSSRFMNPSEIAHLLFEFYSTSSNVVVEEILIRPMLGDLN